MSFLCIQGSRREEVVLDSWANPETTVKDLQAEVCSKLGFPLEDSHEMALYFSGRKKQPSDTIVSCLNAAQQQELEEGGKVKVKVVVRKEYLSAAADKASTTTTPSAENTSKEDEVLADNGEANNTRRESNTGSERHSKGRKSSSMSLTLTGRAEPSEEDDSTPPFALSASNVIVTVRQGSHRFKIYADSEKSTVAEIKEKLFVVTMVPAKQMRLLTAGKIRSNEETMEDCGVRPDGKRTLTMILTFDANFHAEVDGGEYMEAAERDLAHAKGLVLQVQKQMKHRMADAAELNLGITQCADLLDQLASGLDRVPVKMELRKRKQQVIAEMKQVRELLESIRKVAIQVENT